MVCSYTPSFILNAGTFSTYQWQDNSTGSTFTVDAAALGIGLHTLYVDVTDANTCTGVDSIVVDVSPCLGISEEGKLLVSISPNPTNGIINITINNYPGNELAFEITNIAGQTVLGKKITNSAGAYSGQLDITALAKGVYYIRITKGSRQTVKKIILN